MTRATRIMSLGAAAALFLLALHGTAAAIPQGAPEVDPGTLGSGIAILTGAALLLIERFRRN